MGIAGTIVERLCCELSVTVVSTTVVIVTTSAELSSELGLDRTVTSDDVDESPEVVVIDCVIGVSLGTVVVVQLVR